VLILIDQDWLRTDDEATWIVANRRASSWIITVDDGSAGPLASVPAASAIRPRHRANWSDARFVRRGNFYSAR
jgi:hypothetical protein